MAARVVRRPLNLGDLATNSRRLGSATLSLMDASGWYIVGWIIGWLVAIGISLLILFWVVRGAILSALAEDRQRVAALERWMARQKAEKAATKAKEPASDVP